MGFRFRRSVKIAPGIRLNLGKSGASVSLGGRGARVTIGNKRITQTIGLPGTGLSYSTSKGYGNKGSSKIRNTGYVTPKRQQQLQLFAEADLKIQKEIEAYSSFLEIGNGSNVLLKQADFDDDLIVRNFAPENYGLKKVGRWFFIKQYLKKFSMWFLAGVFGFFVLSAIFPEFTDIVIPMSLLSLFMFVAQGPALLIWGTIKSESLVLVNNNRIEEYRKAHPINEEKRIERLRALYNGNVEILENDIEISILEFADYVSQLAHKFELNTSFEVKAPDTVVLSTDLPELENVVVGEIKKALKTGEVSIKEKKEKEVNREYAVGVIGIAFNLASRIFNTSPCIQYVVVFGYTQRVDQSNGKNRDHYVYQIKFNRNTMENLNFSGIDPLKSVAQFEHSISLDKNYFLEEIYIKNSA